MESPFLSRVTCSTRLTVSSWAKVSARFGDAQAVAEHQKQQATVAGYVPAALGGFLTSSSS